MADMKTVEETRRERLAWLVAKFDGVTKLANAIDRTPSQVSQILNAVPHSKSGKPRVMGSDLAREIETKLGLAPGIMDTSVTESGTASEANDRQAHLLSPENFRVPQKPLSWRQLEDMKEIPREFEVTLGDDALAPEFPAGMRVEFEARSIDEVQFGEHVIVRDERGGLHFRLLQQARGGGWEAAAARPGYRTLRPDEDGARVVAVLTGFYVSRRRSP